MSLPIDVVMFAPMTFAPMAYQQLKTMVMIQNEESPLAQCVPWFTCLLEDRGTMDPVLPPTGSFEGRFHAGFKKYPPPPLYTIMELSWQ